MTQAEQTVLGLTLDEAEYARRSLGREPNEVEWAIMDAEWSEHCSYKSSKKLLKTLPTSGERVLVGPGYDAGVLDVGNGYVVSMHIESHNHPSAVDPYGGSATGIGGVLRDVLSVGTRPIALIDVLRFGDIERSEHSQWLLRNVVRGIADYGNCVGVPTVAGEVEFDPSFERNCLVDVACVGVGRKSDLVLAEARHPGDVIAIVGGSTGRDGIRGATFASKNLTTNADSERSSVQVPDPFMKKLLLDSILEALGTGEVVGMKDLGGGGLSSALSEIASKGGTGVEVDLGALILREPDITPVEAMTSESQERMLLIFRQARCEKTTKIFRKYEVPVAFIGRVTGDGLLTVKSSGKTVASLPAAFLAEAPLIERRARRHPLRPLATPVLRGGSASSSLLRLLASPNIAGKRWIYEQYDHEVGVRTVLKPGEADSALLKLPNGKLLAVKADGNSRACSLDPYRGAAGCVAEACRNVVAVGAEPIGAVDHLQFGDPGDEEVYGSFAESVRGVGDYCRSVGVPVVGGKVSFYNQDETTGRPVKPSPVVMVAGLVDDESHVLRPSARGRGDLVYVVGETRRELGGSEYSARVAGKEFGTVPDVRPADDLRTNSSVLKLIRRGLATGVHDCSKGGLAVALAQMSIANGSGMKADLDGAPVDAGRVAETDILFSETHGRFVVSVKPERREEVVDVLGRDHVPSAAIGRTVKGAFEVSVGGRTVIKLGVGVMAKAWESCVPRALGEKP